MLLRIVLLVVLLVSGGCFKTPQFGPELPEVTDEFCEAMRWKDFTTAAGYMTTEVRDDFTRKFTEDKDLYVVGSKIRHVTMHVEENWAEADYVLEYYRLPSSRIKEWHWSQHWRLTENGEIAKAGGWKISETAPPVPWQ